MSPKRSALLVNHITPEAVYTAKFEWLMRWAMHFCGNDRQAAEDLVQDTFTQMLSSWERIRNLEQPEQFLYSCLRYGFLRQRRLGRRIILEGLTSVDYESMLVCARQARGQEIEWQTELRRVVAFLCWRKEAIKSASLLLLRFFHGFFPAEIARITILPRTAVYDAIDYARQETKAHLSDPKKIQIMYRGAPPPRSPMQRMPPDQFVEELSKTIFASCHTPCMTPLALLQRYENGATTPIDLPLLAHLASCRECLDVVCTHLELPPRGSRSLEESLAPAPRTRFGVGRESPSAQASARSLRLAQMRSEEASRHRPRELILFVNGNVVAARDVRSTVSELVIELKSDQVPEFLEVSTEQELILLTAMVPCQPPDCPPQQIFRAELAEPNDGRSLQLCLSHGVSGAQIRLTYVDPLFFSTAIEAATTGADDHALLSGYQPRETSTRSIFEMFGIRSGGWLTFARATAIIAMVVIGGSIFWHRPAPLTAHSVLAHALQTAPGLGIEQQTVRIGTAEGSVVVTLHRDLAHHREPRRQSVPDISPRLESKLEVAGMNWSDPLSAASFHAWRAHQANLTDSLARADGLIVLTTQVSEGTLRASSLTLRESDWHVVGRTASFASGERIEVAELDDSVIPWQRGAPEWFEAGAASRIHLPVAAGKPAPVLTPSSAELDEAEVGAFLALARIGADTTERISVNRGFNAISIAGVVATEARRDQISRALSGIPNVTMSLRTFHEIDNAPPAPAETPPRLTVANSPADPPPFDAWLLKQKYSLPEIARMHTTLLNVGSEMRQAEKAQSLLNRSIDPHRLTPDGQTKYKSLQRMYLDRVAHASEEEAALLQQLHVSAALESDDQGLSTLADRVDENAAICLRLISGNSDTQEEPSTLLQQLAQARAKLETELKSSLPMPTFIPLTARSSNEAPQD